jgi:hypothetical protein
MSNMKLWTTKKGSQIRIKDMSDQHLVNTISFLQRNAERTRANLCVTYATSVEPSSDSASYQFEQESNMVFGSTWEDWVPAIYDDMVEEAKRREIEIPQPVSLLVAEANEILRRITR